MAYTPYVIPYLVAGASLLLFLPLPLRRRGTPGSGTFAILVLLCAFYSFGTAAEVAAQTVSGKWLATKIQYFALYPLSAVWTVFALKYAGHVRRLPTRWFAALSVVPLVGLVLAWTDGHQLLKYGFTMEPGSPYMTAHYGPCYYGISVYQYCLLTAGSVVLLRGSARWHTLFRTQGILLVLSWLAPAVGSAIHVFGVGPMPFLDTAPPAFALGVVFLAIAVFRYGVFDIVPTARGMVIEIMPDGILVIDSLGRVIDANPAAARLLACSGRAIIGREVVSLLPTQYRHLLAAPTGTGQPAVIELPGHQRLVEVRSVPLGEDGRVCGWLIVLHDVTERDALLRDLQAALADVRTLSGLIPICASCKKVRDDDGYWQQVESFVSAHSHAEFTHGICPECMARLYPEQEQPRLLAAQRPPCGST